MLLTILQYYWRNIGKTKKKLVKHKNGCLPFNKQTQFPKLSCKEVYFSLVNSSILVNCKSSKKIYMTFSRFLRTPSCDCFWESGDGTYTFLNIPNTFFLEWCWMVVFVSSIMHVFSRRFLLSDRFENRKICYSKNQLTHQMFHIFLTSCSLLQDIFDVISVW